MALGFLLSWLATLGHRPVLVWLSLSARLILFIAIVAALSRSHGPTAGLLVLTAAVATRALLAKKRLADMARDDS